MLRIFIYLWLFSLANQASAQGAPPVPQANGRYEIPDTGFNITAPPSWEVLRNVAGSTLLFKAPLQRAQITFQATIEVKVFQGPRYIDDLTQQEFGKLIVEKLSSVSNRVYNYRLRSEEKIKMETGDEAILYYTEYQYDDVPIMQMHILISSATHHFLMTYTDLARHFETENSPVLTTAYTSMHSATVETRPASRYQTLIYVGIGIFILLLLWLGLRMLRAFQVSRLGDKMDEEDSGETKADEETEYYSRHSPLSAVDGDDDDYRDEAAVHSRHETLPRTERSVESSSARAERPAEAKSRPASRLEHQQRLEDAALPPRRAVAAAPTTTTTMPSQSSVASSQAPLAQSGAWNLADHAPRDTAPPVRPPERTTQPPAPRPQASVPVQPPAPLPQATAKPRPAAPAARETGVAHEPLPATASQELRRPQQTVPPSQHHVRGTAGSMPEDDLSEEARLSEILPKAGSIDEPKTSKKRGLFWKRGSKVDAGEPPLSEAWEMEKPAKAEKSSSKKKSAAPVSEAWAIDAADAGDDDAAPVSEAWALDTKSESAPAAPASIDKARNRAQAKAQSQKNPSPADPEARDDEDEWNLAASANREDDDEEEVG